MKIAIYARVSTTNHGQDPEVQLGELREYCQRRGWEISHEYADVGISGSRKNAPNWTSCCTTRIVGISTQLLCGVLTGLHALFRIS